jgi:hypothetical protein
MLDMDGELGFVGVVRDIVGGFWPIAERLAKEIAEIAGCVVAKWKKQTRLQSCP